MLYLYLFLWCWDTASNTAVAELKDLVAAETLPSYGKIHPVGMALANALPNMFYALSVEGMPPRQRRHRAGVQQVPTRYKNAHI